MPKKSPKEQPSLFETTPAPRAVAVYGKCPTCGHSRCVAFSYGRSWCEQDTPEQMAMRHFCERCELTTGIVRFVFDRIEPITVKEFTDGIET